MTVNAAGVADGKHPTGDGGGTRRHAGPEQQRRQIDATIPREERPHTERHSGQRSDQPRDDEVPQEVAREEQRTRTRPQARREAHRQAEGEQPRSQQRDGGWRRCRGGDDDANRASDHGGPAEQKKREEGAGQGAGGRRVPAAIRDGHEEAEVRPAEQ